MRVRLSKRPSPAPRGPSAPPPPRLRLVESPEQQDDAEPDPPGPRRDASGRRRQEAFADPRNEGADGPADKAMYTCECGLVFEARVSTSVHCPHCGCGQAW